jgi:hypothetical protein
MAAPKDNYSKRETEERLKQALRGARLVEPKPMKAIPKKRAPGRQKIVIELDTAPFESALAKLANPPAEIVRELLALFDSGEELGRLQVDDAPAAAGELTVRLYPSDRLARLAAAF